MQRCLNAGYVPPKILTDLMMHNKDSNILSILLVNKLIDQTVYKQLQQDWKAYCKETNRYFICKNCNHENLCEEETANPLCEYCHKPLKEQEKLKKDLRAITTGLPKEYFGPYQILKILGRGGMGVVYKVQHPELDIPLALKVLLVQEDVGAKMRFYREMDLVSLLRHPNIIGIHDVGTLNDTPYYTMDYIEGQTLDAILKKKPLLNTTYVLKILEKIAAGLACAHRAGIIHRDIKPGNIMIDEQDHPYLMDFGIAKCKDTKLTQPGEIMGTPDYMPPEQATGKNHLVGYASDVYSLGATMYHALTGKTPFDGRNAIIIVQKVIMGDYLPPRQVNPDLSIYVEAVIQKAMSFHPKNRYANASLMALDLQALLQGKPTIAKPNTGFRRILKKIKKHFIIILCALISCICILISLILFLS